LCKYIDIFQILSHFISFLVISCKNTNKVSSLSTNLKHQKQHNEKKRCIFFTKNVAIPKNVIIFAIGFVLPDFTGRFLMQDGDVPGTVSVEFLYLYISPLNNRLGEI